jgi:hypothetical protein
MGVENVGVIVGAGPLVSVAPAVAVGAIDEVAGAVTLSLSGVPASRVAAMTVAACSSTVRDGAAPGRLHPAITKMRTAQAKMVVYFLIIKIHSFLGMGKASCNFIISKSRSFPYRWIYNETP